MAESNKDINISQIREEIHKEAKSQAAKGFVFGFIALISIALTGWWLYLKPQLVEITGGVPKGAIVAFDLPGGCPKEGWQEFKDASGKFIIGISSSYKYRMSGGDESYALRLNNLPPIMLKLSTINATTLIVDADTNNNPHGDSRLLTKRGFWSSNGATITSVTGGNTGTQYKYHVMPPYLPLHLCKKT